MSAIEFSDWKEMMAILKDIRTELVRIDRSLEEVKKKVGENSPEGVSRQLEKIGKTVKDIEDSMP